MVTFWLLIDTIAMIGSPAARGAAASVACSGRAWRGAASAGGAAVSTVRAAVATNVTTAAGRDRRIAVADGAVVNRFVTPCSRCLGRIASKQRRSAWMVPVLPPAVNKHFRASGREGWMAVDVGLPAYSCGV